MEAVARETGLYPASLAAFRPERIPGEPAWVAKKREPVDPWDSDTAERPAREQPPIDGSDTTERPAREQPLKPEWQKRHGRFQPARVPVTTA